MFLKTAGSILLSFLLFSCIASDAQSEKKDKITEYTEVFVGDSVTRELILAARNQTLKKVKYDGSYYKIPYPNGDVPDSIGVCTDVVIRAYRSVGYDLQKLIHEDMRKNFEVYKKRRYSAGLDPSIDHRRTPNMETFFTRKGHKLVVSDKATDYAPGDIVFWDVAAGHVGMVVNVKSGTDSSRFMVIHNIGAGPRMEDFLFRAKITGHYRYRPW